MRLIMLLAIWAGASAHAVDTTQLPDPVLQARYSALTHELRCMQCQNESIADSPVDLAADLRAEVRDMLLAGKSDDDVRDFMVARYGEFILFRPRFSARNAYGQPVSGNPNSSRMLYLTNPHTAPRMAVLKEFRHGQRPEPSLFPR